MKKAKVFKNGQSQAIRLPKEYRVDGDEVYVNKLGNTTFILSIEDPWGNFIESFTRFSDDFFSAGRSQPEPQDRETL